MTWRALWLAVVLVVTGCAPAAGPRGPLEPLMAGWEQHFTVDWRADPRGPGVVVWGYLNNQSPYTFDRVRVLVDALGPDGQITSQRIVWAPGLLGGGGRTYFEVPMELASNYRVRPFSYDRVETDGLRRGLFW
jgi:hypothetical protein